ncbi:sensor histidine kinase [Pedobacter mucosus]|uniref:sensor histidine kinase n=1 Tax=Pedobacter mucosus TaxID=2895286 RepID=UPI001EE4483B|nr:sensor histidine kinase [Pedobacter mucosus]UKT64992.1 sensor histidine kinase [Pedobacter mucosus]
MKFTKNIPLINSTLTFANIECRRLAVVLGVYTFWWLAVIVGLISLQGSHATIKQFGSPGHFSWGILHTVIKGALTYYILIYKFGIPFVKKENRKKIIFYYLVFLVFLVGYEYSWDFKIGVPLHILKTNISMTFYFVVTLLSDGVMAVVSVFIATWIESNDAVKRGIILEKQKLQAELSAIRYQINPHFLFNSLSFIYAKTIKSNADAAHAVNLLSEIMRYALEEWGEQGLVPLALEIAQIKKVIEMNRIRFNNKLNVDYQEMLEPGTESVFTNANIPALALITLVENAFKHADLTNKINRVTIRLRITPSEICFSVRNRKKTGPKEPSHGIGLANIKQRLLMTYGDAQRFLVTQDQENYLTEIYINTLRHD